MAPSVTKRTKLSSSRSGSGFAAALIAGGRSYWAGARRSSWTADCAARSRVRTHCVMFDRCHICPEKLLHGLRVHRCAEGGQASDHAPRAVARGARRQTPRAAKSSRVPSAKTLQGPSVSWLPVDRRAHRFGARSSQSALHRTPERPGINARVAVRWFVGGSPLPAICVALSGDRPRSRQARMKVMSGRSAHFVSSAKITPGTAQLELFCR